MLCVSARIRTSFTCILTSKTNRSPKTFVKGRLETSPGALFPGTSGAAGSVLRADSTPIAYSRP